MRQYGFLSQRSTCMRVLSVAAGALATVASLAASSQAGTITFGAGANTFAMEFKTIGNPGNANDTTGNPNPAGRVDRTYDIGKFEVSRDMIIKYNANFGTANNRVITLEDMDAYAGNGANKPATGISWNEAARFVNWLNTSTGYQAAYKFGTGSDMDYTDIELWNQFTNPLDYDSSNPYRSKRAKYFLPSYNEWYKAAFYDPNKTTGSDKYWNYATRSDTRPTQVDGGTGSNEAVYGFQNGPADVDNAGGLSAYGVMGLNGNVAEWEESSFDLLNNNPSAARGLRGDYWGAGYDDEGNALGNMSSLARFGYSGPNDGYYDTGFRVASLSSEVVPEPSMMVIVTVFGLGGLAAKRRRKK